MGAPNLNSKLQCPYPTCHKTFEKPIVLTDNSHLVRETYYACPHCRSKVQIIIDDPTHPRLASVEGALTGSQITPVNCQHQFGYLQGLPEGASIPDECAVCPKVLRCYAKNRT